MNFLLIALLGSLPQQTYSESIHADEPVLYWSFDSDGFQPDVGMPVSEIVGTAKSAPGARPPVFPLFGKANRSLQCDGRSYIRIADPGEASELDFEAGDSITIEAWVSPTQVRNNGFVYIIGKGRTYLPGVTKENHNWALRLKSVNGSAAVSFLFRSRGEGNEYHRWTSSDRFGIGDGWHHVAVTYTFGRQNSLRGYIDGQPAKGTWDLGGATDRAPVVDDDEVWVGSALAGQPNVTFRGGLDEIAVYRKALSADRLRSRYRYKAPTLPPVEVPEGQILVEVFDGVPNKNGWTFRSLRFRESFTSEVFAFPELPKLYNKRGLHVSRPTPFLVRAHADVVLPPGKHRILFRSREASRLFMDDRLLAETKFYAITAEANGPIWELDRSHGPNIRPLPRGDRQAVVTVEGDGRPHRLRYEALAGLHRRRADMGDASVSIAAAEGDFQLISFGPTFELTEDGWKAFQEWHRERLRVVNKTRRDTTGRDEIAYWKWRHELAADQIRPLHSEADRARSVDDFIDSRLQAAGIRATPQIDGLTFLRRAALDVIGTVPNRRQIEEYLADPPQTRRSRAIDRLLSHPGWADHWVSYWQDVLAENPNIVNPSLNNTGPFRWWIHESFLENKPMDRFATELVMMEGGRLDGGPGGFAMATENDVPMAAKGHVLGQAFLGVQMQCARCHDAPGHDVQQRDLFSLAAMLKRSPQEVPKTSSINVSAEELKHMAVKVTLQPGEKVVPAWTFQSLFSAETPEGVLRDPDDSRERLAATLTLPANERFARVMVNRVWHRYIGRGIVESLHDWESLAPSHPQLLEWLGREFIASGYDLRHIARLILNSRVYQRESVSAAEQAAVFAGPMQRALSAEQMLDSLFVVSGKPFDAGMIAFDIDGARPANQSIHLGEARRAWMFTSTSNERDRPGLAMPFAQPFVTFLEQFGWRGARQNPVNERPDDLTALQPAEFANGVLVRRTTRLSDDHSLTSLALRPELTLDELVDELHLRVFTRSPSPEEHRLIADVLRYGFETRRRPDEPVTRRPRDRRGMVSWSNHLEEEASTIKLELEQVVRRGDPPTRRLDPDWRERLEDVIWSLVNSPEFRFAP